MKTLKLKHMIDALRRTYPKIDPRTRYLYDGKLNKRAVGDSVMIYVVATSDDQRATLHRTVFRRPGLNVMQWHAWLREHAMNVLNNQVRAYMSRTRGGQWKIERVFGWHLLDE